ncbi:MAG: DNA double-strand break repair nuclease NurA [Nanoarchaeota archaeon]|nr:DNA double-strand break repair nuclease NurA [Nanoarchaeota archaeon]
MKIINHILNVLNSKEAEVALSKELKGLPLTRNNFTAINGARACQVYAVDGGSSVISDGGAWIIAKIKIAVVGYDSEKKNHKTVSNYYASIINKNNYEITVTKDDKVVDLTLPDFNAYEIDEVPSKIMKILEWKTCRDLCNKGKKLFIMMDSPLEADNKVEEEVIRHVSESDNTVIGFCKTSRMRTTKGRSLLGVINGLSDKLKSWYYYPLYENEEGVNTFILKLNKISRFSHKVQMFAKENDFIKNFEVLAFFARDSETLGYPYPLVKADKIARITNFEKRKEMNIFERELKKTDLINDTYSQSFHAELDKRMYKT